jgi:hypothetical protein
LKTHLYFADSRRAQPLHQTSIDFLICTRTLACSVVVEPSLMVVPCAVALPTRSQTETPFATTITRSRTVMRAHSIGSRVSFTYSSSLDAICDKYLSPVPPVPTPLPAIEARLVAPVSRATIVVISFVRLPP